MVLKTELLSVICAPVAPHHTKLFNIPGPLPAHGQDYPQPPCPYLHPGPVGPLLGPSPPAYLQSRPKDGRQRCRHSDVGQSSSPLLPSGHRTAVGYPVAPHHTKLFNIPGPLPAHGQDYPQPPCPYLHPGPVGPLLGPSPPAYLQSRPKDGRQRCRHSDVGQSSSPLLPSGHRTAVGYPVAPHHTKLFNIPGPLPAHGQDYPQPPCPYLHPGPVGPLLGPSLPAYLQSRPKDGRQRCRHSDVGQSSSPLLPSGHRTAVGYPVAPHHTKLFNIPGPLPAHGQDYPQPPCPYLHPGPVGPLLGPSPPAYLQSRPKDGRQRCRHSDVGQSSSPLLPSGHRTAVGYPVAPHHTKLFNIPGPLPAHGQDYPQPPCPYLHPGPVGPLLGPSPPAYLQSRPKDGRQRCRHSDVGQSSSPLLPSGHRTAVGYPVAPHHTKLFNIPGPLPAHGQDYPQPPCPYLHPGPVGPLLGPSPPAYLQSRPKDGRQRCRHSDVGQSSSPLLPSGHRTAVGYPVAPHHTKLFNIPGPLPAHGQDYPQPPCPYLHPGPVGPLLGPSPPAYLQSRPKDGRQRCRHSDVGQSSSPLLPSGHRTAVGYPVAPHHTKLFNIPGPLPAHGQDYPQPPCPYLHPGPVGPPLGPSPPAYLQSRPKDGRQRCHRSDVGQSSSPLLPSGYQKENSSYLRCANPAPSSRESTTDVPEGWGELSFT
ncbi:uncharacterized protein LOC126249141 [Schistocerca nitens]|uniref:uncharacterized protein LOC126249141 n=1 Tax=Schistocerca nitens TaxID=7011 RepID=UPI002119938B|nr:uncharacterized protein LOC126249141 [Schistocerca nitens]